MKKRVSFPFFRKITAILILAALIFLYLWKTGRDRYVWTALGERHNDGFGEKVASAGYVRGDGYPAVAIWAGGVGDRAGKVYVYYGSKTGLSKTPDWAVQGESPKDQYGRNFSALGSVKGNDFNDFIVTAQGYDGPQGTDIGKAYLYAGSPQGLGQTPIWTMTGDKPMEMFGDGAAGAGDVNGAGFNDVIIGAYGDDHFRGAAYLFYGSKNGLSANPAWQAKGERLADWFGYSVGTAGDVNGDGYSDVIVSSKQSRQGDQVRLGKVYVFYGSKNGLSRYPNWEAEGEGEGDQYGWWVTPAEGSFCYAGVAGQVCHCLKAGTSGDVNGHGYSDVVVGASSYSGQGKHFCGKVYVYYGSPAGLPCDPSWTYVGEHTNDFFGESIAFGDFNGDGYSDIIVAAPYYDHQRGKIYLFLGSAEGLSPFPCWTEDGEKEGDMFGTSVANAGDVIGDGYDDLIVGAPYHSEGGRQTGKAYLFYGGRSGRLDPHPPTWWEAKAGPKSPSKTSENKPNR